MKIKKLVLNRETVRLLSDQEVITVAGAGTIQEETNPCICERTNLSGCCDTGPYTCDSQQPACYTYFTNCTGCTGLNC